MDATTLTIGEAAAALRRGETTALAYADALLAQAAQGVGSERLHPPRPGAGAPRRARRRRAQGQRRRARRAARRAARAEGQPRHRRHADHRRHAGPARPSAEAQRGQSCRSCATPARSSSARRTCTSSPTASPTTTPRSARRATRTTAPRIPGGSSGGVGVAVGARIVPGGIGSDTGGSVRIPAALCGIVGFRPTTGRWSQAGIVPISHTRDTAGPMTRSVADCALLDGVVTGGATSVRGGRAEGPAPRRAARALLGAARCRDRAPDGRRAGAAEGRRRGAGRGRHPRGRPPRRRGRLSDRAVRDGGRHRRLPRRARLEDELQGARRPVREPRRGRPAAEPRAATARSPRPRIARRSTCSGRSCRPPTAITSAATTSPRSCSRPTPLPAAPIGDDETVALNGERVPTFPTFIRNTSPGSVAGIPGISIPAAMTAAGLPLGLELDAAEGADARLLAVAMALEQVLPKLPAPRL